VSGQGGKFSPIWQQGKESSMTHTKDFNEKNVPKLPKYSRSPIEAQFDQFLLSMIANVDTSKN
jgi:hypothetical protein